MERILIILLFTIINVKSYTAEIIDYKKYKYCYHIKMKYIWIINNKENHENNQEIYMLTKKKENLLTIESMNKESRIAMEEYKFKRINRKTCIRLFKLHNYKYEGFPGYDEVLYLHIK